MGCRARSRRAPYLPTPRQVRFALLATAGIFLALFPVLANDVYHQNLLIEVFLLAIMASSWNIISGFAGYVSLGQGVFLGIGAYTVAILSQHFGLSPFVFVPVAGLVTAAVAAVVGLVLMRSRGSSFVILTIAVLFLTQFVGLNWSLTHGSEGLSLPLPTWSLRFENWPFYYSLFVVMLLTIFLSWWILRSKFGMGLVAIREDEGKAATVGISTPVYKVLGFVASAIFIGVAGGIYAYYLSYIDPVDLFDVSISIQIVLAALLGGAGTIWGPVLGAFLLEPLLVQSNQQFGGGNSRLVLFGGVLVLVTLLLPRGFIPSASERWRRWRTTGRAAVAPTELERPAALRVRGARDRYRAEASRPMFEARGVQKNFGGVRALQECSVSVPEGSITALIGPNGSGKTTLFNIASGTMSANAGEVWFDGRRIDRLPPWRRAHLGLSRTYQITRIFRTMTVLQNVVVPLRRFSWLQISAKAVSGKEAKHAEELLEFVGMREFRDYPAGELSYGQQKLVELAQALMLDPKLMLLDEPGGGISPALIERIIEIVRTLNRQGKTFLIVEHNMPMVLSLCDPVLVLARGHCICRGTPEEIQSDAAVLDAYLGEDLTSESLVEAR